MDNNGLSIGKLSKITGLTTSAINFYIRNKVIPPPLKTSKTRALFPESSVELLKNIVKMRNEKIPLKMIKYILNDSSDKKSEKNKDYAQQQKIKSLAAKNLNEFLELTGLDKFLFDILVEKSIIKKPQKDNNYFNYSEISLGKSIKDLIDHGIPLEVIERHSEYEPLSEAEALFLLEHLKNSRSYNQETKEKIIGDFEIIRNIMRLNKLRELEQRLI